MIFYCHLKSIKKEKKGLSSFLGFLSKKSYYNLTLSILPGGGIIMLSLLLLPDEKIILIKKIAITTKTISPITNNTVLPEIPSNTVNPVIPVVSFLVPAAATVKLSLSTIVPLLSFTIKLPL